MLSNFLEEFLLKGYVVIPSCIASDLLAECQSMMEEVLDDFNQEEMNFEEGLLRAGQKIRMVDLQDFFHEKIQNGGVKQQIFLGPKLLGVFIHLIGPDLAFTREGSVCINTSQVQDPFCQKKWHQEVWSGAGPSMLHLWAPIYASESSGKIQFIEGSHHWGLIPNSDREPTELPEDITIAEPSIAVGDVAIFHSLTLHKTSPPTTSPRIALATSVRNIYHSLDGLARHSSWQNFHLSPMADIERILGNPYLSPFRIVGGKKWYLSGQEDKY